MRAYGVEHVDDLQTTVNVVLVSRVSSSDQAWNANLASQQANLRKEMTERGNPIVREWQGIAPEWGLNEGDRLAIKCAVEDAKRTNAVVVFESVSRLVRNQFYHPAKDPDVLPTEFQMDKLMRLLDGVPVATVVSTDASPSQIRSYESKRGQREKGSKPGRPPKKRPGEKKRRREQWRPKAVELRTAGLSLRKIAGKLHLPHSTV